MGKLKILTALLLAAALTACGDDSDVFYTTSYPVARIEISVSLSDFTHHNGGPLVVRPAADAETVTGTFIKEPDKPEELHFTFGEQAYTCKVSGYTDTDDLRKTLFSVDLTEEYKQLYPDAGVTQVIRKEYTSHPY